MDAVLCLAQCLPRVLERVARRSVRLLVLITAPCCELDEATVSELRRLHESGWAILAIYLDRAGLCDTDAGVPVPGSAALVIDPAAPIPARTLALAALDALHRADPTRAL